MDPPSVAECKVWHHVLNCGFRLAAKGETDIPCMSGERLGIALVYAKLDGVLTFDKWLQLITTGHSYARDRCGHLLDFNAKASNADNSAHIQKSNIPSIIWL